MNTLSYPKNQSNQSNNADELILAEAQIRLKRTIPKYLKEGWILHPGILTIGQDAHGNPQKDFSPFLDFNRQNKIPDKRLILNSVDDLPPTANCVLGRHQVRGLLDIDDLTFFEKVKHLFPKPYRIVKTGKGLHWLYERTDTKNQLLTFGEFQNNGLGGFIPGSYHPVYKCFYEIQEEGISKEPITFNHIKDYLKSNTKNKKQNWEEGDRNNTLFRLICSDLEKTKGKNIPKIIETAIKKGLDWDEIKTTSKSATQRVLDKDIENLISDQIANKIDITKPKPFYGKILLDNEFNFFYGAQKLGKSRALIWIINEGLKKIKGEKNKCAIISTDNDPNQVLSPLLNAMGIGHRFLIPNPKIITKFGDNTPPKEKTSIFLNRIRSYLTNRPNVKCLLLDPLPRWIDWNKEQSASYMIDQLRDIAREFEICIVGVRNEGKNQQYDSKDRYKGSSAIGDTCRQVNRSLKCHKKSTLGKDHKEKTLVVYTELSSLFSDEAYLFKLVVMDDVAIPELIKKITEKVDAVKYLSSRESGNTLSSKIISFIQKKPEKGCTLDDLYHEFGEYYPEDTIKKCVYRNFDHKKVAGTTYIQLKSNK